MNPEQQNQAANEEEYLWWQHTIGKIGGAVMALGGIVAVGGFLSNEVLHQAQDAQIAFADKVETFVPPDSASLELLIGGSMGMVAGQQIMACGYRRDKRRSED